ncbi:MAG: EVE domain-containing protein [Chloroflexi bacterium]|jgi:hypothetical protein|nr:MAG: EVE domain-containing protein [Chloroflexota bacterium]
MANPRDNRKEGKKPRNYWLVVLPSADYKVTKEHGLSVQGVRSKERKKAQRMLPGDRMVFYLPDVLGVPAAATVTSEYFEGKDLIWRDSEGNDPYPFRVNINADVSLEEKDWLDLREIGPRLLYVRRWTPEEWALAFFQGQLHLLPQQDFKLLEDEMRKLVTRRPRSRRGDYQASDRRSYEQDVAERRSSSPEREDQPTGGQQTYDQQFAQQPATDQQYTEQPAAGQQADEQYTDGQQIDEQPAADQQFDEQPVAEQQGDEQQIAEQPAAEQQADDQPLAEQPNAEQQADEQPGSEPQDSEGQSAGPIVLGG